MTRLNKDYIKAEYDNWIKELIEEYKKDIPSKEELGLEVIKSIFGEVEWTQEDIEACNKQYKEWVDYRQTLLK